MFHEESQKIFDSLSLLNLSALGLQNTDLFVLGNTCQMFCTFISQTSKLRTLDLSSNSLDALSESSLQNFWNAIAQSSIQNLNIEGRCRTMSRDIFSLICNTISQSSTLKTLVISEFPVWVLDKNSFLMLKNAVTKSDTLTYFSDFDLTKDQQEELQAVLDTHTKEYRSPRRKEATRLFIKRPLPLNLQPLILYMAGLAAQPLWEKQISRLPTEKKPENGEIRNAQPTIHFANPCDIGIQRAIHEGLESQVPGHHPENKHRIEALTKDQLKAKIESSFIQDLDEILISFGFPTPNDSCSSCDRTITMIRQNLCAMLNRELEQLPENLVDDTLLQAFKNQLIKPECWAEIRFEHRIDNKIPSDREQEVAALVKELVREVIESWDITEPSSKPKRRKR